MAHRHVLLFAMLTLVACGGGQPAGATATPQETAGAETPTAAQAQHPAGGPQAPTSSDDNEFKLNDSTSDGRHRGVEGSKIEPTATEAAVRFIVVDKDKGPVRGIVISLAAPDGQKYYTEETDAKGFAEVLVPIAKQYDLVYLTLGRKNISAKVKVADKPRQNINLTLRYKRFEMPKRRKSKPEQAPAPRFVLTGVQFDTDKARIRPESFARLDEVVEFMTHKESARIEISGHTDNVGDPKHNLSLSEKRAQACRDYLVSKGIDAARIDAVGYGDKEPIAPNDTAQGRQRNRRIEATEL